METVTLLFTTRKQLFTVHRKQQIRALASAKLNTLQMHVSKMLEDCDVSDVQYKLVPREIEKHCDVNEEIRYKRVALGSVIDEATIISCGDNAGF